MTSSRKLMCNRLSALGIRQSQVHSMVDEFEKWLKRSGPEWTVKRLKDAKSFYVSKLTDTNPEMETWWSMTGPKGNQRFTSPWLNMPFANAKQVCRALNACNAYTVLVKQGMPTERQLSKFTKSVDNDLVSLPTPRSASQLFFEFGGKTIGERRQMFRKSLGFAPRDKYEHLNDYPSSRLNLPKHFGEWTYSRKNAPVSDRSNRGTEEELKWVSDNLRVPAVAGRLFKYRGLASASGFLQLSKQVQPDYFARGNEPGGGKISFIQEPGYKLRAVANPYRVHQVVLEPLKAYLMRKLRSFTSDCTHDQEAGQEWCQAKLKEGRTVHAVDLSDATNNIPLESQVQALLLDLDIHDKTTTDLLSYFIEVSRDLWTMPKDLGEIRWNRGQPMGLGPSFGSFAHWHNLVLRECWEGSGSEYARDDVFRIVGDDVVIACDKVHSRYREMLAHLDIPVSESKCISSNKCTEFVGRVITATDTFPTVKWREVSDRNFLDVLKYLGPPALSLLRPRQRRIAKAIAAVPQELGGLGWNPGGIPMEDRVQYAYDIGLLDYDSKPEESPVRDLTQAMIRNLNKVFYHGGMDPSTQHLLNTMRYPNGGSTESPFLASGQVAVQVESDLNSEAYARPEYQLGPLISKGYPRGSSRLESLEDRKSVV